MNARWLAAAAGAVMVAGLLAVAAEVRAATPTPTATVAATPEASATAAPPDTLRLRLVNDLNGDGVAQDDEPGLAGWSVSSACSDAILTLTADADGYVDVPGPSPDHSPGVLGCFRVDRPFGWLPTRAGTNFTLPASYDVSEPYLVLLHDLGRTVMELHGEAISAGLPMVQGDPEIAEPFTTCGHLFFDGVSDIATYATIIVSGGDTVAGCPAAGNAFSRTDSGPFVFAPGASVTTTFVDGGDSMRFYTSGAFRITAAWVLDVASGTIAKNCFAARDLAGFVPSGSQRVFVLSSDVADLAGCGAPGRQVQFFSGDQRLAPIVEWRAGDVDTGEFSVAPAVEMSLPETGSAGLLPGARR